MDYAKKEGHEDLAELAEKLATVMLPPSAPTPTYKKAELSHQVPNQIRYVGGIR
jgi:hypothetical protein